MSILNLCNERERRFLSDLLQDAPDGGSDHPILEHDVILRAIAWVTGEHFNLLPFVSAQLMFSLARYAQYAHRIPEDVEGWS